MLRDPKTSTNWNICVRGKCTWKRFAAREEHVHTRGLFPPPEWSSLSLVRFGPRCSTRSLFLHCLRLFRARRHFAFICQPSWLIPSLSEQLDRSFAQDAHEARKVLLMSPRRRNEAWHRGHKNPIIVFFTISFSHYKSRLFRRLWYIYIFIYLRRFELFTLQLTERRCGFLRARAAGCGLILCNLASGIGSSIIKRRPVLSIKRELEFSVRFPIDDGKDIWLSGSGSRLNAISLFFRPSACEKFDKAFFSNLKGREQNI
jgi:hypothetical protein